MSETQSGVDPAKRPSDASGVPNTNKPDPLAPPRPRGPNVANDDPLPAGSVRPIPPST